MALISDLVEAIAEVEGIPQSTVELTARYAREAGYLSTGARGRNAPHATTTDAANLLVAVNAGGCIVKDSPAAIASYRTLSTMGGYQGTRQSAAGVEYLRIDEEPLHFLEERDRTFGDVLEEIINRFVSRELEVFLLQESRRQFSMHFKKFKEDAEGRAIAAKGLETGTSVRFDLAFHRPVPFVRLSVLGMDETYAQVDFVVHADDLMHGKFKSNADRRDETVIGYRTLSKVAEVLRGPADTFPGLGRSMTAKRPAE